MGALKDQLRADLKTAMKEKDENAKACIRMALSAIQNEEVSGKTAHELSDSEELKVISREVKKRVESAEAYQQGGREDLADKERAEGEFLQKYLPEQLSTDDIAKIVASAVTQIGDEIGDKPSMKQMGKVMKLATEKIAGRAPGKLVSELVKKSLAD